MKGQVAVFIIVGLLAVIALSLTLYSAQVVGVSGGKVDVSGVQGLVESCLEQVGSEGIMLLGKQGGFVHAPREFVGVNKSNISFALVEPQGSVGVLVSNVPQYPFVGFPFLENGSVLFAGYYGVNVLPPLYGAGENAIEGQLELFIEEKLPGCADWEVFGGLSIDAGVPNVSVVMARSEEEFERETAVSLELDWTIKITGANGVALIEHFTARVPVRLAKTYYVVKGVLDADASDVRYVPVVPQGFVIVREVVVGGTVLRVKDKESVNDEPFEFVVARKNRAPALWQVNVSRLEKKVVHVSPEGKGTRVSVEGSVLVFDDPCSEEEKLSVQLNAQDPDEDVVRFEVDVPGSSEGRIPKSAIGVPYKITVRVTDGVLYDYQDVLMQVGLCEVR